MNKSALILALVAFSALVQTSLGEKLTNDPFIVGGEETSIEFHPHQLALLDMVRGVAPSGYMCGASNIHRFWALTAAHCVDFNTAPALVQLYGGSTSRLTGGHLFFIQRYVLHPSYGRISLDFDVAIIEVNHGTPLDGWAHVAPIPIPTSCETACCGVCAEGPQVVVAGWGRVDDGSLPENLMQVSKDVLGNAACSSEWIIRPITARMFCTLIEDGRDSCNGDSGSAVVRSGVQVGIVSFGSSVCGDGSRPAVYVRLEDPQIRSWIHSFVQV